LHSVTAPLLDPQANKTVALAVGQPSRMPAGDMRFGALIRQQVLTCGESSSESSSTHSITEADFSPNPPTPAHNAVTKISIPQTIGSSASASHSAPEGADFSMDSKSPPWIGEGFGSSTVAEPQQKSTTIRPIAAAGAEVESQAAAGSSDDAMQARELDASPAAIHESVSSSSSRAASSSGDAPRGDSESDTLAGTESVVPQPVHGPGLTAAPIGARPSSAQLKSARPAEANPTDVSGTTVSREGENSGLDLATTQVVPPAKPALVPGGGKESAPNLSTASVVLPGKPAVVPGEGKRPVSNPSAVLVASTGKPALVPGGGKKPQTDSSAAHLVSAQSTTVPAQPATASEPPGATNRPADISAVTAVPVTEPGGAEKHRESSPNIQPLPPPNPYTNAPPLHSASRPLNEPLETQQIANSAAILSGAGRAAGIQVSSRSIAVAPAIQADSADHLNAALNRKLDHSGLQGTTADSVAHAPASPRFELSQCVNAVTIAGTHATNAMTATRPPGSSVDSPHVPTGATFDRMDSAAAPQVIENSSRRLAVGVRNADLGWVEIRTSNAAGQVSATVATGSIESHNVVSAQLPSMREYLAGQQVRIDHLASESFSPSSGHRGASPGDQSRDGGGARNTKAPEQAIPARTSVADPDAESLSYINVRV
jgi:hypothetical protein